MIQYLVVHCADTPNDLEVTAADVHKWHMEKGWSGGGYNAFIRRNGLLEQGRPDYWEGAHVRGLNDEALGVCLAGRDKFTPEQMHTLAEWIVAKRRLYPMAEVVGHYQLDPSKTCPNFDAETWWKNKGIGG